MAVEAAGHVGGVAAHAAAVKQVLAIEALPEADFDWKAGASLPQKPSSSDCSC